MTNTLDRFHKHIHPPKMNLLKIDTNSNRIYGLDILRAFAILIVVIGHSKHFLPKPFEYLITYVHYDGVSLFFVLSGFLIGNILIKILECKEKNISVLFDFWKRRWLRTLPAYFIVLSVLALASFCSSDNTIDRAILFRFYVFCQNLFYPHPNFFNEAWSLSVEEWFYLLIPIILFVSTGLIKTKPKKAIIQTAVCIIVIVTLFRVYRYLNMDLTTMLEWDTWYRKQVFTRLDSLMFGVLGAYFYFYYKENWIKHKNILIRIGLILFITAIILNTFAKMQIVNPVGFYNSVFSFTLVSLSILLMLPYLNEWKSGGGIIFKTLTYISLISYSMYLLNLTPIIRGVFDHIDWSYFVTIGVNKWFVGGFRYILFWMVTIILSILSYKYIELPFMKLRDKKSI